MSRRIVGNYRGARARGASVPTPPRSRQRWLVSIGRIALAVFAIAVMAGAGLGLKEAVIKVNTQQVSKVQIEGKLDFADLAELEQVVNRYVAKGMVALDLDLLKQELEADPWVRDAEVLRQWPDILIIRVEEEAAIARWGESRLVNRYGELFEPERINDQLALPYLFGPQGSAHDVMLQYKQFNQLLYPLGVRIRELELNDRGAWTITFMEAAQTAGELNVTVKVGRDEVLQRMRRLVVWLESDEARDMGRIESIDLRYANGLAVAFREEARAENPALASQ